MTIRSDGEVASAHDDDELMMTRLYSVLQYLLSVSFHYLYKLYYNLIGFVMSTYMAADYQSRGPGFRFPAR